MRVTTVCCAMLLGASTAHAQDDKSIDEVIITGSRILERIDEVPSSVAIIDREAIARELTVNPELQSILATRVPGMAPSTGSTSNFGQTLRGRTALVMIDGVPQSTPLRNGQLDIRSIDPAALQRIEVVKGATSVYGNGAAGGIINYITKDPGSDNFNAEARLDSRFSAVESSDSFSGRFSTTVDGSVGDFSYLLNGVAENRGVERDAEGDIIGLAMYGLSEVESRSLFSKFGYQIDADKSLALSYSYYDAEQNSRLVDVVSNANSPIKTYAVEAPAGTVIAGAPQGPNGNYNLVLQYRDEALLNNTRLAVDAYTQEIENVFFYSSFFADPSAGYDGGNSVIASEKNGLRINLDSDFTWSGVDATFIYGLDALQDVSSQPLADGRSWVPDMDMSNRAAYLQSKWVLADNWVLKAGARREFISIDVPNYTTLRTCNTSGVCQGGNSVNGGELDYQATTYNAGIRYNAQAAFSPFASFSQGFDVSDLGLLLRAANVPNIDQVQTEASVIDHYEVGFSGVVGKLNYEMAAYRSKSELGTSTIESPPNSGLYVPVRSPQNIKGYELALGYQASDALELGATYSWVEGKDPDSGEYLDGRKIAPPKFTAYLDWQALEALNLSVNYLAVGDRDRFEPINGLYSGAQGPVSDYDIFNLSSSYSQGGWLYSLGVENLLNEDYYPARSQAFTYNGYNTKGLGRTVNLGINYNF